MYHIYILSSRTKICPRFPTFSTKESFVGNLPSLIKLVTRRLAVLIYLAGEWIQIEMIGISVCNDVSLGDKNVLITWHADSAEVETQVNAVIHMHFDCIRQTSGTNSTSWLRCHKPPYLLPLSLSLPLSNHLVWRSSQRRRGNRLLEETFERIRLSFNCRGIEGNEILGDGYRDEKSRI